MPMTLSQLRDHIRDHIHDVGEPRRAHEVLTASPNWAIPLVPPVPLGPSLPPEDVAELLAILEERKRQGLPGNLGEELAELHRRQDARNAQKNPYHGKCGRIAATDKAAPAVVRRPKEYANEAAFHCDLLAACNRYWEDSGRRREPSMRGACDAMGTMDLPGKRFVSEATIRRGVREFYGSWGEWLAIWRAERE